MQALATAPVPAAAPLRSAPILRKLLARFAPFRARTALTLALMLVRLALEIAVPFVVKAIVDGASAPGARPGAHLPAVLLLAGMFAARAAAAYASAVLAAALSQDVESRLRSDLFDRVLALRFRWHDRNRSGKTIVRALRDMERAKTFFREVAFGWAEMAAVFALVLAAAFALHWSLGLVILACSGTGVLLQIPMAARVAQLDLHADDAYDHATTALQENVAGARVIRGFGREPEEVEKFGRRLGEYTARAKSMAWYWTSAATWIGSTHSLAYGPILVLSAFGTSGGWLTVGAASAAVLYVRSLHQRLRNLNRLVIHGQQAVASASRVFEVLENEDVLRRPDRPAELPPGAGGVVRFEDVSFAYTPGTPVLANVTLDVPTGGSLGILGPTGAGKTTLASLLPRFYDPDSGRVTIDGTDIRDLDPVSLRRAVGLVHQEAFLFSATVAENIAYGNPAATREDVERCARLASAHEFVSKLPQGYETRVGERGVSLSGGQRQRLTIARALAMDPRVLVFDDATAAVDALTEHELFEGIRSASKGRTTLVISQRITALRWCDRIAVIERGRVADVGTHEELLARCPLYAEIEKHQRIQKGAGHAVA
ncbi:MAG: putative multidrug export ATP-binding/permease protein [Planctomycetes bacterium]|nr:putative multidrug export ATP-binding/permease protein [Planctomycetota bacterium]